MGREKMIAAITTRSFGAVVIAVAVLFLPSLSPIQAIAAPTVRAAVEVFVCSNDREDVPMLSMYAAGSGNLKMQAAPRWSFSGNAWRTSVDVPQGNYVVSARSKRCSGLGTQWYALSGATRHVTLTLNEGGAVANIDGNRYAGVVYGSLPSQTAQVEVMPADSVIGEQRRSQGSIDGDMYQQAGLSRGRYILRISVGSVIVSRQITLASSKAVVRADFTPADAAEIIRQQARGSGFIQVSDSSAAGSQTYRLGNGEVDGWITNPLIPPSDYNIRELRLNANILAALTAAQQFLIKENQIPIGFKNLTAWNARILNGDNDCIVVGLLPNDATAWEKAAPPTEGHCVTGAGMANVLLTFDIATHAIVGTPTICSKV
jgi:hypothetical protein